MKRSHSPRRLAATFAAGAVALVCAPAAGAHAVTIPDPGSPGADECDIEWVAVDHPPSVNGRIVRHTIKTKAPYGVRPALYIRRPDGVIHKLINGRPTGPDGPTRVWQSESPATAPDTIALSFDVALIGNPDTYKWRAIANCAGPGADVAPEAGWTEHRLRPAVEPQPARATAARRPAARRPCLWPGRDCHPPARLWYRVALRLEAKTTYFAPPGELYAGPYPYARRVVGAHTESEIWEVESNNAVRLTLACADRDAPDAPFLVERRVRGRRRPIGGCGRDAPARLKPAARFTAIVAGATTQYRRHASIEPFTIANGHQCSGSEDDYELTRASGLSGVVSTDPATHAGLHIALFAAPPQGTAHSRADRRTCTPPGGSPYIYFTGRDEARPVAVPPLYGQEYVYQGAAIGWTPAPGLVRFSLRPRRFGHAYVVRRQVRQPQPDIDVWRSAPVAAQGGADAKEYTYTLRLTPCPDRGLDVQRC